MNKNTARKTTVVNLRKEPYDVYIGRAGKGQSGVFGNPIRIINARRSDPTYVADVLVQFKRYFLREVESDPAFRSAVLELRGKRLGCFCKPGPCHGDIIAAWVDAQPEQQAECPAHGDVLKRGRCPTCDAMRDLGADENDPDPMNMGDW